MIQEAKNVPAKRRLTPHQATPTIITSDSVLKQLGPKETIQKFQVLEKKYPNPDDEHRNNTQFGATRQVIKLPNVASTSKSNQPGENHLISMQNGPNSGYYSKNSYLKPGMNSTHVNSIPG